MIENIPFFISPPYRAADQLNALGEVEGDEVFRIEALLFPLRIGAFRAVHHDEVGLEFSQLFIARTNEHVLTKCACRHFGNETYAETGIGVGAAESVDDKQAFTGQLLGHQPFQMLPVSCESGLLSFYLCLYRTTRRCRGWCRRARDTYLSENDR